MSTITLHLTAGDRPQLMTTIERLINLLDTIDADPEMEEGGDHEPVLGWPNSGGLPSLDPGVCHDDEREDIDEREFVNEDGGDIQDEPHDHEWEYDCPGFISGGQGL